MRYGNEHGAIQLVKHGIRTIHSPDNTSFLDTPIASLVNARSANILEDHGIHTIGEFLMCTIDELRSMHEFGDHTIIKCLQAILQDAVSRVLALEDNKLQRLTQSLTLSEPVTT